MVDLSTTGGSAQFVLEKGFWRHGQQGSNVSSHSSTCSCGLHFGWQTLCSGQRFSAAGDLSVSRPTQSGSQSSNRCWLLPLGEWRQQLGQHQTPQELQSGHSDRLLWSYPGLGCHQGHSDGGILVEDSGVDYSSIASFTGVSEAMQLH